MRLMLDELREVKETRDRQEREMCRLRKENEHLRYESNAIDERDRGSGVLSGLPRKIESANLKLEPPRFGDEPLGDPNEFFRQREKYSMTGEVSGDSRLAGLRTNWSERRYIPSDGSMQAYFVKQTNAAKYLKIKLDEYDTNYCIVKQLPMNAQDALVTIDYGDSKAVFQALAQFNTCFEIGKHGSYQKQSLNGLSPTYSANYGGGNGGSWYRSGSSDDGYTVDQSILGDFGQADSAVNFNSSSKPAVVPNGRLADLSPTGGSNLSDANENILNESDNKCDTLVENPLCLGTLVASPIDTVFRSQSSPVSGVLSEDHLQACSRVLQQPVSSHSTANIIMPIAAGGEFKGIVSPQVFSPSCQQEFLLPPSLFTITPYDIASRTVNEFDEIRITDILEGVRSCEEIEFDPVELPHPYYRYEVGSNGNFFEEVNTVVARRRKCGAQNQLKKGHIIKDKLSVDHPGMFTLGLRYFREAISTCVVHWDGVLTVISGVF